MAVLLPAGTLVRAGIWSDPDADGDPADAALLATAEAEVSSSGFGRIAFESGIEVGGDGTSFFVGLWFEDAPGWRLGFDSGSLARQGFVLITTGGVDPEKLAGAQPAGSICAGCNGDWSIRAIGCDQPWCGTGSDVDGDGTVDRVYSDDPTVPNNFGAAIDPLGPVTVKFQGARVNSIGVPDPASIRQWRRRGCTTCSA